MSNESIKMQVFLKTLTGTITLDGVDENKTVLEFKEMVKDKIGTPVEDQKIVHSGKELENSRTLKSYDVQKESTLSLITTEISPEMKELREKNKELEIRLNKVEETQKKDAERRFCIIL